MTDYKQQLSAFGGSRCCYLRGKCSRLYINMQERRFGLALILRGFKCYGWILDGPTYPEIGFLCAVQYYPDAMFLFVCRSVNVFVRWGQAAERQRYCNHRCRRFPRLRVSSNAVSELRIYCDDIVDEQSDAVLV